MDIRCDLFGDIETICGNRLTNAGYEVSKNSHLSVLKQCLNVLFREVQIRPRQVKIHPDLVCPQELEYGFNSLIHALDSGQNVNIYLSSNLTTADFQDGFLNDYGLHHFHLGSKLETSGKSKGFIQRTGPVVLAYITDLVAYLIDIKTHGRNGDPYIWTDQNVMEKIHNEWPGALSNFRLRGILASNINPTQEEKKTLRQRGVNTSIEMPDGTVYMSPGGGVTTAKTSTKVQIQSDRFRSESSKVLKYVCDKIKESDLKLNYPIRLKLLAFEPAYFFYCQKNKVGFRIDLTTEYITTRVYMLEKLLADAPIHFELNEIVRGCFN
ncbi:hypothetical protein KW467_05165 [Vibrio fluvialis]|nr:hypothetical protein [Vibrio fluvialis]